ncbi:MAG TPA: hypothetical protein VLQ65_02895 [Saliniramus sp.]|nr:hypothetical protein [Saliniramus sp.]
MNGFRLTCLAGLGAASLLAIAVPAAAFDGRHQVISTVGVPIATRTTAQVVYVVPVVPTVLGIRPAPVGQPVVYVIEAPESAPDHRQTSGRAMDTPGAAAPQVAANGPRIIAVD